ncbi:MAG: hypothetical protein HYV38_00625 [Candidatus Levybacteria bacterium]|nr:hypothetical protein [Candidatus Levybacteria bacterium]MBI2420575.1 hypothetical protein [Candidatus Levybacteria bacterium]MBI4098250.1 hypothetical protein [Candidatus Levybacteria bacterium]
MKDCMRKLIFLISIFLILLFNSPPVFAQTPTPEETELLETVTPTPVRVEYQLPYPGLLPGSPLYPVKKLRDRIMEIFITDPLKKSDFYLLQADKNLATAIILFDRGRKEDSESTVSKGENYLEKSLSKAIDAKERQRYVIETINRLELSSMKYQEILKGMSGKSSGDLKKKLENSIKRAEKIEKMVKEIKSSK